MEGRIRARRYWDSIRRAIMDAHPDRGDEMTEKQLLIGTLLAALLWTLVLFTVMK